MTSDRLENRIKKLCEQALRAELRELQNICEELRATLYEYEEVLSKLVSFKLSPPHTPVGPEPLKPKSSIQ